MKMGKKKNKKNHNSSNQAQNQDGSHTKFILPEFGTTTVGIITNSGIFLAADGMAFNMYKGRKPIPTAYDHNKVFEMSGGRLALVAGHASLGFRTLNRVKYDNDELIEVGRGYTVDEMATKCRNYMQYECTIRRKYINNLPESKQREHMLFNSAITVAGFDEKFPRMWVISVDMAVSSDVVKKRYETYCCEGHGREVVDAVLKNCKSFSPDQDAKETKDMLLEIMIAASSLPFCGGILRGYKISKRNNKTCLFEDHVDDLTVKLNRRKMAEWLAEDEFTLGVDERVTYKSGFLPAGYPFYSYGVPYGLMRSGYGATAGYLHDPLYSSRNRGFSFVEYYNSACAEYSEQNLSNPDFKLDGSTPSISWFDPKSAPDPSAAAQVKALYVKNLPENTTTEQLKELFQHHGEVTKVVVPPAKAGQSKRESGFIHFADRSSALKAVKETEKYEIDGHVLDVSLAKPMNEKKFDGAHSYKPGFLPAGYPSYSYGDPYGLMRSGYGATAGYQQPMIYGRGPMPAGMRMVPMVLPDGRLGYVLQQPGAQGPASPPRARRNDRSSGPQGREGGSSGGDGSRSSRRYHPY